MRYEPRCHPRRSIRLKGYDYAQPGAYVVTLCTHERAELFGSVTDGAVVLNPCGAIGGKKGFKPAVLRLKVRWEGMDLEEKTLAAIRRYITANPARWALDRYTLARREDKPLVFDETQSDVRPL